MRTTVEIFAFFFTFLGIANLFFFYVEPCWLALLAGFVGLLMGFFYFLIFFSPLVK